MAMEITRDGARGTIGLEVVVPGRQSRQHHARDGRHPGRGRRRGKSGERRDIFAAIDLGSNNCRLLIARPAPGGFHVIDGFSRIVRLGEQVGETNMMSEAAMTRTIEALEVCASKIQRRAVTHARYVATEAARRALNRLEFIDRVRDATGLELEIISSREEAELTLAGCLPLLDDNIPHALVFDVGGGSAELIWLRLAPQAPAEILGWVSLPCGVVNLTERHGGNEFSAEAYAAIIHEIQDLLRPFDEKHGIRAAIEGGTAQMLGTAGTVTTIAGVNMGLKRYNRSLVDGSYLDFSAVHLVSHNLASSTFEQRAAHPSIGHGRADLVVAGCAVLEAVCRTWPAGRMRVADRGVREGILSEMLSAADQTTAQPEPSEPVAESAPAAPIIPHAAQ
jgi:exopolyphosphatase / guanosine-5'-triphosphate,3'-diphosphate pyrophosphatase